MKYNHHQFLSPEDCEKKKMRLNRRSLLTNKARLEEACKIILNERCSAVLLNKLSEPYNHFTSLPVAWNDQENKDGRYKECREKLERKTINEKAQELLENEEPDSFLSRGLEKSIDQSDLECYESTSSNEKNEADSENSIRRIDSANTPANEIDEKKPELKNLPQHLEYAYLHRDKSIPIIISSTLSERRNFTSTSIGKTKRAIAWKMSNIKGISLSYSTHKILMEDDYKPVMQPQRRLNPKVQDVVKNEIVKTLDSELIYPISESSWVSLIHVVPKKGGMTIVLNYNNEFIHSHTVTGWRVCIDYRKLNDATRKDHFPLPFIDQMLERLCGNEYYCFLDGFSRFFQIPITSEDQEKTTFTCPYGTFAYRRMPLGLCNAPATFQRCMTAIFHDMVEDFMEVFMDDFSVFGNSFD
ncbi:DNA-directed DNA polymerase [Tanacetum coccineum]